MPRQLILWVLFLPLVARAAPSPNADPLACERILAKPSPDFLRALNIVGRPNRVERLKAFFSEGKKPKLTVPEFAWIYNSAAPKSRDVFLEAAVDLEIFGSTGGGKVEKLLEFARLTDDAPSADEDDDEPTGGSSALYKIISKFPESLLTRNRWSEATRVELAGALLDSISRISNAGDNTWALVEKIKDLPEWMRTLTTLARLTVVSSKYGSYDAPLDSAGLHATLGRFMGKPGASFRAFAGWFLARRAGEENPWAASFVRELLGLYQRGGESVPQLYIVTRRNTHHAEVMDEFARFVREQTRLMSPEDRRAILADLDQDDDLATNLDNADHMAALQDAFDIPADEAAGRLYRRLVYQAYWPGAEEFLQKDWIELRETPALAAFAVPLSRPEFVAKELIPWAFDKYGLDLTDDREGRDRRLLEIFGNVHTMNNPRVAEEITRGYLMSDAWHTILAFSGRAEEDVHLNDRESRSDDYFPDYLQGVMRNFSRAYPRLVTKQEATGWFKERVSENTITRAIDLYYDDRMMGRPYEGPHDIFGYIESVTNFPATRLARDKGQASELLDLILDVASFEKHGQIFTRLRFTPEALAARGLLTRYLTSLRDVERLYQSTQEADEEGDEENPSGPTALPRDPVTLDVADLTERTKQNEERMVTLVSELFGRERLPFTVEDFHKLERVWGDLSPIFTLVSRYRSERDWDYELAPLRDVFMKSLAGAFATFKFQGGHAEPYRSTPSHQLNELAQQQLEPLVSDEAKAKWIADRAELRWVRPSGQDDLADAQSRAADELIETNLRPHARALFESAEEGTAESERPSLELALALWPESPELAAARLEELGGRLKTPRLQKAPAEALAEAEAAAFPEGATPERTFDFLRLAARLLREEAPGGAQISLWQALLNRPELADRPGLAQLKDDVAALKRLRREQEDRARGGYLVATVINSDPRFLLTVGDLVHTASCQNYRTGSVIQTLLGYVIDANVKAMASFVLDAGDFDSPADYRRALALSATKGARVSFDGNLRRLSVRGKLDDEKVAVESRPLGHAHLRNILKLGEASTGGPALLLERDYLQLHAVLPALQRRHREMRDKLAADLGAKTSGGSIQFPASRNPGGVYSDAASGKMIGAYGAPLP